MNSKVAFEGKDIKAAILSASKALRIDKESIKYEVVSLGSRGLFGIGARNAVIRIIEDRQDSSTSLVDEIFNCPEKKEKKENGPDLSEKMMETRSILLSGEVNKELAEKVVKQLLLLEAMNDDPIRIFIDSPGGDVDAGYAIFDMIRFVKPKVYTIGMGLVASAGALILLAAPKEQRLGLPNSHYLIHQPLSGMRGVATEIEIHAKELEKTRKKINEMIAGETGQPVEKVEKDTDRDYWLNAFESVEYGLLSQVVNTRSELDKLG